MQQNPGTYVLILRSRSQNLIQIGKLGRLSLTPGFYIYVGSAFGPGGIKARIAHHKKLQQRPHWHIDYLRKFADLTAVWFSFDVEIREHQWAHCCAADEEISSPMKGFGSSDCRCHSHLFFKSVQPDFITFRQRLIDLQPEHAELFCQQQTNPIS